MHQVNARLQPLILKSGTLLTIQWPEFFGSPLDLEAPRWLTEPLSRNFRSPTRESAQRVLLFRGFSGMKAASLTWVEHTTARRLLRLSDRCCAVIL